MGALCELVLELTDQCPQNCMHCSSSSGVASNHHLDPGVALRIIREAHALGATQVSLGGGEPTSSPILDAVLTRIAAFGVDAEVFTSGVIQGGRGVAPWPDELLARLRVVPRVKVIFSVHGPDSAIHDSITRVPGSFHAMLSSVDQCVSAGILAELNFVPMRPNASAFPGVIRLALGHRVRRVSVLRFVPQGRGLQNRNRLELSRREEDEFVQVLLRSRRESPVEIRTGSPFNKIVPGNNVPCRAGVEKLVVQADGNVLPCEVFKHADTRNWGLSVYRSSLASILASDQLATLREGLSRTNCLLCPVHGSLRFAKMREERHGTQPVSQTALRV